MRITSFRLLAAMALAAAASAGAHADTLGFHIGSQHLPSRHYNNFNPGIYYRVDAGWTGGIYRNSLEKTSTYAGYTWSYGILDVTTAAVTGYKHKVQPLVVPSLSLFTYQGFTPRIAYIPRVEKRVGSHVLHLMVEYDY